jgi:4-hydroxybenzoate polyprenyltransferase
MPAWSFYLLGARAGTGAADRSSEYLSIPSPPAFAALTFILVTSFLINQIFDRDTDRLNKKVFYLSEGLFSVRALVLLAVVYFLVASFFFHLSARGERGPLVAALLLALTYSLPPFRICCRPFLDLLWNALGFGGVAFALGYAASGNPATSAALPGIPYVLLVGGTFVFTTLLDREGDAKTGKKTTAVMLGEKPSVVLASALFALAPASALVVGNLFAAAVTGLALPFCLYGARGGTRKAWALAVQGPTLTVILAAGSLRPVFFALVVPLVVLARYYYRRRFNLVYPGVSEDS